MAKQAQAHRCRTRRQRTRPVPPRHSHRKTIVDELVTVFPRLVFDNTPLPRATGRTRGETGVGAIHESPLRLARLRTCPGRPLAYPRRCRWLRRAPLPASSPRPLRACSIACATRSASATTARAPKGRPHPTARTTAGFSTSVAQCSRLTPMMYRHVLMVLNRCTTSDNETVVGAGPCACPETGRPRGAAPTRTTIPYFGLLANSIRSQRLALARQLLGIPSPPDPQSQPRESRQDVIRGLTGSDPPLCPICRHGRLQVVAELEPLPAPRLRSP